MRVEILQDQERLGNFEQLQISTNLSAPKRFAKYFINTGFVCINVTIAERISINCYVSVKMYSTFLVVVIPKKARCTKFLFDLCENQIWVKWLILKEVLVLKRAIIKLTFYKWEDISLLSLFSQEGNSKKCF